MKRLLAGWTFICGVFPLFGAPVGNSAAPDLIKKGFLISEESWVNFRLGYEGDFVEDGRMNQYNEGTGRVDTYKQWTNSGTATLNILDHLEVFGVFGSSETKADWRFENLSLNTVTRIEFETNPAFLWAAGGRAIVYEWNKIYVGLGGRYTACNAGTKWVTSNGAMEPVGGSSVDWREWQINLDFSYKIDWLIPYIGAKYLNAKTDLNNFSIPISQELNGFNSFENRDPVGLYLGCTLTSGSYFILNLEGRLIDEEAITITADFRF